MIEIKDNIICVRKIAELEFETQDDACMDLSCVDYSNLENIQFPKEAKGIYSRIYYMVEFKDNSKKIYFTTNEPDEPISGNDKILEEEYIVFNNFEEMINEFEISKFINYHTNIGYNSPPKYTNYYIIYLSDDTKQYFLNHLKQSIIGYNLGDLEKTLQFNIDSWLDSLIS